MCRKSTLKLHKTILRVFCIKKHMHWKDEWLFFFKTPKEFNLNGLDEWAYCLNDVRWKYYLISSLDVNKVWLVSWCGALFHWAHQQKVAFLSCRQCSENYWNVLKIPLEEKTGNSNRTMRRFKYATENPLKNFTQNKWVVTVWQTFSPDLIPIENLKEVSYMHESYMRTITSFQLLQN